MRCSSKKCCFNLYLKASCGDDGLYSASVKVLLEFAEEIDSCSMHHRADSKTRPGDLYGLFVLVFEVSSSESYGRQYPTASARVRDMYERSVLCSFFTDNKA